MTKQDIEQKAREFQKELRYYVIKRKHLKNGYDEARVKTLLDSLDLPDIECVVVEHDWPMYHDVWYMIQQYVETGKYESQRQQMVALEQQIAEKASKIAELETKDYIKLSSIAHSAISHIDCLAIFDTLKITLAEKDAEIERLKPFAEIGQRWRENSSLQEWFPYTAIELESIKNDVMEKAVKIQQLQSSVKELEEYKLVSVTKLINHPGETP